MELLAPAGDWQSFYAAVYNGADAVYLGLQTFNARMKADNFNTDNIQQVVDFAHLYHVKVYVTVNILVKDAEVPAFIETVRACIHAKVDAFIIQDLGMAHLLSKIFPGIVLHASTQMGIHNLSGAKVLENLGFRRVVLARETKLADIKLIRAQTKLEIEYFVQGALCVAFSGNCYLSSIKNGNSGNRGKCLQLCRLPYRVYQENQCVAEGYYLSAKDLCLMKRLPELAEAGVDCLKIEGRLKRAAYVAQVTRSYRQALDDYQKLDFEAEQEKIRALFSRGAFNETAYLENNFNKINPRIAHHQGRKIGRVLATERFKNIYRITLQIKEMIGQNDALRLVQGKQEYSVGVGNVNVLGDNKVEIFSTQNIPVGCEVYLLKSAAEEKDLCDFVRSLPVDFYFTAQVGKPAELVACRGDVTVQVHSNQTLASARNAGLTAIQVEKQLSKLKDTPFVLNFLECNLGSVFMPVAELNDLRRQAVVALKQAILARYNADLPQITETKFDAKPQACPPKKNFYLIDDAGQLPSMHDHKSAVILCPKNFVLAELESLVNAVSRLGVKRNDIYLDLPVVAVESEMQMLDGLLKVLKIGIVANNYAHARWIKSYSTIAGLGLNIYNRWTAQVWLDLGCENVIWSLEQMAPVAGGSALVSGYPTLMTLCHCPVREIYGSDCRQCRWQENLIYADEKGNRYRIRRVKIQHCYFELFSAEKYLQATQAGKIEDLRKSWKSMQ